MFGILNHSKSAVGVAALALAVAGAGGSGPGEAAVRHQGWSARNAPIEHRGWAPAPLAGLAAGATKRAPEANGSASRVPQAGAQAAGLARLRDPFKSPEPPATADTGKRKLSHLPAVLPPGVRGLLIDQLVLEGVVDKLPGNTMIAVVTNKTNRAYFLRVNEQVFDGTVTLITPEAIYFRQHHYSDGGKAEWRTVEKRFSPGAEGTK